MKKLIMINIMLIAILLGIYLSTAVIHETNRVTIPYTKETTEIYSFDDIREIYKHDIEDTSVDRFTLNQERRSPEAYEDRKDPDRKYFMRFNGIE